MPLPAAVVAALSIAMAVTLVVFIVYVAVGGSSVWVLPAGAVLGVAAGVWFFTAWWRGDPKRRRGREAARRKRARDGPTIADPSGPDPT